MAPFRRSFQLGDRQVLADIRLSGFSIADGRHIDPRMSGVDPFATVTNGRFGISKSGVL
jgi:hypothetical protein